MRRQADRTADRRDYRAMWLASVRSGIHGQRLDKPATWRLDGLWSAAAYQLRAEETEELLRFALDNNFSNTTQRESGLSHRVGIEGLLDAVESAWDRAHQAFAEYRAEGQRGAA